MLLCLSDDLKSAKHLGWRFSRTGGKHQSGDDAFYAVIVEHKDEDNAVAASAARAGIFGSIRLPVHPKLGDLEIAPRRADAWMLTALAATLKAAKGGAGAVGGAR